MSNVTEKWRTECAFAAIYDTAVERERVARVAGSAMWGTDTRQLFAYIARGSDIPAGSSVLDVPCGAELGFEHVALERSGAIELFEARLPQRAIGSTDPGVEA